MIVNITSIKEMPLLMPKVSRLDEEVKWTSENLKRTAKNRVFRRLGLVLQEHQNRCLCSCAAMPFPHVLLLNTQIFAMPSQNGYRNSNTSPALIKPLDDEHSNMQKSTSPIHATRAVREQE
jgi:hypothetical protein